MDQPIVQLEDSLRVRESAAEGLLTRIGEDTTGKSRVDTGHSNAQGEYKLDVGLNNTKIVMRKVELIRLLAKGLNIKAAAVELGIAYSTARAYMRDPLMMQQVKALSSDIYETVYRECVARHATVQERAREAADDALEEMIALMHTTENDTLKVKIAQDLMDRDPDVRISRNNKITGQVTHVHLEAETLIAAAAAANEIAQGPRQIRGRIEPERYDKDGQQQ